jgi:serine/threonine protein kinase
MQPGSGDTTKCDLPVLDRSLIERTNEPGAFGKVGSFHLQEELGRGGMGVVYKAWDDSLRRVVAVKFIRQDRSLSSVAHERFFREARAAAAVSHPNIVVVHRIDEVKGTPFIVMEYVDGESLEKLIAKGRRFTPMELLQLILQITEGLQAAHENGIVHRDIKPSNVMVESGSGRSKISDFGLARVGEEISSDSEEGTLLGTPAYMSPEQVNGTAIDGRSDLFSLGCLIYALVTGRSPFQGKNFADTATRVLSTTPKPLTDSSPSVPAVLSNICSRLLEKNPEDRYQSAKEISQEIRGVILDLQKGADVPMADTIIVRSPSQLRKLRMRIVAGMATVVLGVIAFLWMNQSRLGIQGLKSPAPQGTSVDKQRVLTVSRDQTDSDFRSITGALTAAQSGDTIRVLDNRSYEVNLQVRGMRDITIESPEAAQLVPLDPLSPLLQVAESQNVTVRGFRIKSISDQHAIHLLDSTAIVLEDLEVIANPKELAVVQIDACNRQPGDAPLVMQRCRIGSERTGQCLWVQAIDHPIWNLELRGNTFVSQGTATGIVLALKGGSQVVAQNVVDGGHVGINMELKSPDANGDGPNLRIEHNTFFQQRSWIGLMGTDPRSTPFELKNNLVLDSPGVEATAEQQAGVTSACRVAGNVWERDQTRAEWETEDLLRWATIQAKISVRSRVRGANGYLILTADSPFRRSDNSPSVGALP